MKIAIVTGASSGMGAEFARQLDARRDVDEIWLIARREDRLRDLGAWIRHTTRIIPMDLTNDSALSDFLALLAEEKPSVAWLVNAAGYGIFGLHTEQPLDTQIGMVDLNITALVKLTYGIKPYLAKGAKVIQLGSASTYHPVPYLSVYAATKNFVKSYSRAIAREWKAEGITVTCVCPGWVRTEFFDRAGIDANSKDTLAKPSVAASDVVKKAIRDADRGKDLSLYGWYNRLHHAVSSVLPPRAMISIWMNLVKKKHSQ